MKPVLWIHKASGRIRFEGANLPESWTPLYAKAPPRAEMLEVPIVRYNAPRDAMRVAFSALKNIRTPLTVAEGMFAAEALDLLRKCLATKRDLIVDELVTFLDELPNLDHRHPMHTEGYLQAIDDVRAAVTGICELYDVEV